MFALISLPLIALFDHLLYQQTKCSNGWLLLVIKVLLCQKDSEIMLCGVTTIIYMGITMACSCGCCQAAYSCEQIHAGTVTSLDGLLWHMSLYFSDQIVSWITWTPHMCLFLCPCVCALTFAIAPWHAHCSTQISVMYNVVQYWLHEPF